MKIKDIIYNIYHNYPIRRWFNHKESFHNNIIFSHGGFGCIINKHCKIGKNVKISHNVTIGGNNGKGFPTIEDNCIIYCNSIIIGGVNIGKNTIIGAGTFVNKDIPPNSIVYNKKELIIKKSFHT